ncbi:dentin sialophosphoprotein-like [Adelges cooleyi]|uniref:dentin sialophosphoprotein-like n=1 Tax=Adelges cooleyi TaxID=133065 RepID=UPI00217FA12D|nr:dentin sialophosphoprotein-like [Adelges cooleyi]
MSSPQKWDTAVERVDPTKDDSHSLGTINNNNNNNNIVIVEQREIETNSEEDDAQTNSGDCCVVYDHQTNDCTTGGVPPSWPEEKPEIINDGGCDEQMDVTKDYTVVVQQHGSDIDVPSFTAPGDAVMMSSLLSTISIGPAHSLAAPEQSHPEFTAGGLHQTPEEPPSSSPKPLEQKQPCDTRSDTVATDYQSGDSVRLNAFGDQDQDAAISSNSSDSISDDDDSDSDQDTTRYGRFKYHGSAAATDENCGEEEEEEKYITTVELDRPTTSSYEPSPPQSDQDDEPLNYYSSEDESLNYSSEIEERDDWDEEQEQSVTPASEYTARRSDSVENEADQSCSQEVSESNTVEDVHDVVAPKTNPITVFSSFNLAHSNIGHRQKDDDDLPGTVKADVDDSDDCTTAATTLGEVESEETDDSQPTRMVVDEQQQPPNSFLFGQQRRAEDASDDNDKPVFLFGRVYASQSDTTASADCTTTSTCASSTTVTGDCASDCNTSETETFTIASTTASTVNTLVNAEETESQDTIPYGRVDDDDIRDIVELKSLPDDSTSDDDGGTITPHNARSRSSCSSVHSEEEQQESSSFRSNSLQPESSTGGAEPPRIVENSSSEQNAASQQLSQPDAAETTNVDNMMVHDTSEPFVLLVNCDWQTTGGAVVVVVQLKNRTTTSTVALRNRVLCRRRWWRLRRMMMLLRRKEQDGVRLAKTDNNQLL